MNNKRQIKNYVAEQINIDYRLSQRQARRIETICRAAINHLSYELKFDNSIYLIKGDKKIYIERNPNLEVGDGYGCSLCYSTYKKAVRLLDDARVKFPRPALVGVAE